MDAGKIIQKLRLDKASKALIINAPKEVADILAGIEYDAKLSGKKKGQYDFVAVFASTQTELEKLVKEADGYGVHDCLFWACYPKGTGKIKSDIKRETVWAALHLIKLDCVTQVAIDNTWSALRARPYDKVGK